MSSVIDAGAAKRKSKKHLSALIFVLLSACGGGGGGDAGGVGQPAPVSPAAASLLPAAPALGATLYADAATLRPLRDGAVWRYRGTQTSARIAASPVGYTSATTHSDVASNAVTENFSNSGNAGADSQSTNIVANTVGHTESIDFAGKGSPEVLRYVELRSPVRIGDQFTMLDKHYTDTAIDNDGDGKPDPLDVALYGRVVGAETLSLAGLPVLDAVRVDAVLRLRVTSSRTGAPGDVVELTQQTWYAAGIGIVRQRITTPPNVAGGVSEVVDEQLESWDGVSAGFGAMPTQDAAQPASAGAVAGQVLSSSQLRVFAFAAHTLVFSSLRGDVTRTMASRFDLRGRVLDGRVLEGLRVDSLAKVAQLTDGLVLLDTGPSSTTTLRLTRLASDGALNGAVGAVSIDLTGGRLVPSLGDFAVAGDGDRFWLLFSRGYRDTDPQFTIRSETVLRAYSPSGTALTSEIILPQGILGLPSMTSDRGRLLLSWSGMGSGYTVQYGSVDIATGVLSVRTLVAGLSSSNIFVTPLLLDTGGALLWSSALGSGAQQDVAAGVRLDAGFTALRSSDDPASELIPGLPTYIEVARPAALGARVVLATRDGPTDFLSQPQGNGFARVSWFEPSSTALLKDAALNAVSFELGTAFLPKAQAVYADRTLVFSASVDANTLRSTLVWLNDGKQR